MKCSLAWLEQRACRGQEARDRALEEEGTRAGGALWIDKESNCTTIQESLSSTGRLWGEGGHKQSYILKQTLLVSPALR